MGRSYTGSRCLFVTFVRGCRRVPSPPASTTPFILTSSSSWPLGPLARYPSHRASRSLYGLEAQSSEPLLHITPIHPQLRALFDPLKISQILEPASHSLEDHKIFERHDWKWDRSEERR